MRTKVFARGGSVEFHGIRFGLGRDYGLKRVTIMDAGPTVTSVTADRDEYAHALRRHPSRPTELVLGWDLHVHVHAACACVYQNGHRVDVTANFDASEKLDAT
jgi:hypothetical protein